MCGGRFVIAVRSEAGVSPVNERANVDFGQTESF